MLVADEPHPRRPVGEQRAAAPQVHAQRHDQRLAQRIDGRVRHLGEALPQVGVQGWRHPRERRNRGVVSHAPDAVLAGAAHRFEPVAQILEAPAEGDLARDAIGPGELGRLGRRRGRPQRANAPGRPAREGSPARHLALRLRVPQDRLAARVDHQEFARAEAAAVDHQGGVEIDQPRLGARDHQSVPGDLVAAGSEAVAIERGAHDHAVGEGQCRGPVPRLD